MEALIREEEPALQVWGWREGPGQAGSSLEEHRIQFLCHGLKAVIVFPIPNQPRPPGRNSKVFGIGATLLSSARVLCSFQFTLASPYLNRKVLGMEISL